MSDYYYSLAVHRIKTYIKMFCLLSKPVRQFFVDLKAIFLSFTLHYFCCIFLRNEATIMLFATTATLLTRVPLGYVVDTCSTGGASLTTTGITTC